MADFDVSIGADIGDLLSGLRGATDLSKKEFRDLTRGIERSFKDAKNAARDLRRAMDRDVGKQGKQAFESVKQAAEALGGSVGGAAGMVEKFGRSISEAGGALGPAGAAAAVAGVAITGLGLAVSKVVQLQVAAIQTTIEWAKELDQAGTNAVPGATTAVLEFSSSIDAAKQIGKELAVLVGGELLGASQQFIDALLTVAVVARDAAVNSKALGDTLVNALAPGLQMGKALGLVNAEATALGVIFPGVREKVELLKASFTKETEETKKSTAAVKDNTAEWMKQQQMREAFLADIQKMAEAELASQYALQEQRREFSREIQDMAYAELEAERNAYDRGVDAARRAADEIKRLRQDRFDTAMSLAQKEFQAIEQFADLAMQNTMEREDLTAREKQKRISQAFAISQAAAVSSIAIDAAKDILALIPFFAFLGPGAPAAAAGVVAPVAAAQTALVLSRKPPTFPTGGMVGDKVDGDHVMIAAQRREAVLTSRGVDALGGPAGVAAANSGARQPMTVNVHLPGDVLAQAIVRDRSVQSAIEAVVRRMR